MNHTLHCECERALADQKLSYVQLSKNFSAAARQHQAEVLRIKEAWAQAAPGSYSVFENAELAAENKRLAQQNSNLGWENAALRGEHIQ